MIFRYDITCWSKTRLLRMLNHVENHPINPNHQTPNHISVIDQPSAKSKIFRMSQHSNGQNDLKISTKKRFRRHYFEKSIWILNFFVSTFRRWGMRGHDRPNPNAKPNLLNFQKHFFDLRNTFRFWEITTSKHKQM